MKPQVEPLHTIPVGRSKVLEVPVLEGMIEVETLIVGATVAVPMVIIHVGGGVDVPRGVVLDLGLDVRTLPLRWGWWHVALIGARGVRSPLFVALVLLR